MSQIQIPKGWQLKRVDDIIELLYGKNLPKEKRDSSGKFPVYGSNGIVGYHDTSLVDYPSIVVGRKGTVGAINIAKKNFWPTDVTYYVKIKESENNPLKFIFYLLSSLNLPKYRQSGPKSGLNRNTVNEIEFLLPPIPIRKKIVQKLDYILGRFEEKKKTILELQKRNIGLFEKLTKQKRGRERQLSFVDYLADTLVKKIVSKCESNFPNYTFKELEFLCKDIIDTPHSTVKYYETGIPVIRTSDIEPYKIDFSSTKFTSQEIFLERKKKLAPQKGDILYAREAPWGIAAQVSREKFVVGQRILLLRPDREKIQSDFFTLILNSSFGYNQAKKIVKSTTSEHVNIGDIKKFLIPLIPKTEQEKTITIISEKSSNLDLVVQRLSQLISQQNKMMKYFENLHPTILNFAFTGKLVN